jgi:hypothetical protein
LTKRSPGLHMTIGAALTPDMTFAEELRLLRVGLLYADRITLCSPRVSLLTQVSRITILKPDEQVELMLEAAAQTNTIIPQEDKAREALAEYKSLSKRSIRYRKQEERLRALEKIFAAGHKEVEEHILRMLADAGAEPIVAALNRKLVELYPLKVEGGQEGILAEFVEQVQQIVKDQKTYTLFDEPTGRLLGGNIQAGRLAVSDVQVGRGRSAPLVATLLERLPLFETVSFDDLLGIKEELSGALVRFRGAMLRFAETIESAPWDSDFPAEIENLIHRDVTPAVTDIEEAIRNNSYVSQTLLKVAAQPLPLAAGSFLALAISQASALPTLAAQALGLSVGAAVNWAAAHQEWLDRHREATGNELYFYYKARQRLS